MGADAEKDKQDAPSRSTRSVEPTRATSVEPRSKAPDDLTELLARAAMLQSQYREFETEPRAPKDSPAAASTPATEQDQPARQSKNKPEVPIRWRRPPESETESQRTPRISGREVLPAGDYDPATGVLIPHKEVPQAPSRDAHEERKPARSSHTNESARPGQKQFISAPSSRWSVLGQMLSTEGDAVDDRLVRTLSASIALPFQFAASVSGGAGVTTILATLARCLATHGEHLLLADPGASSLLPLYFGANNPGEGELQSFLMPDSDAGVAIVNSRQASAGSSSRSHVPKESRRNLIATIRNAAAHSDRLLLDAGAVRASDVQSLHRGTHFGLMPVAPDLSCVFGLMRLEETLQSRESDGRPIGALYYVLNKFDSSLTLHRDIKASLEERLGERMVPVTIRRSDAVAEALADGMTVIDYCPEAGVAEDFQRLADWIRSMAPIGQFDRNESR